VPYEGVVASNLTSAQQQLILDICNEFLLYHATTSRQIKLKQVKNHFSETYFCWIGGYGDDDAYYFRVQSLVNLVEFDHYSGVFLAKKEPAKFHMHTILRRPNATGYERLLERASSGCNSRWLPRPYFS
jgi:hypothetical protein